MAAYVAYIAASANRHNQAADTYNSLVAFASSSLIALWDVSVRQHVQDRGVHETLPGHEGLVTCVRFISDDAFASADDKGILRCWRKLGPQWKSTAIVRAHSEPISSLCVHDDCISTGSSDASVKIWRLSQGQDVDELQEIQVLPLHGRYPLALALARLPQSRVTVLAVAGTDRTVQIWTRSGDAFVRSAVLSGHEDWVRTLAFRPPLDENDSLILASGSQDATIRLWKIEVLTKDASTPDRRPSDALSDDLLDAFEASLSDLTDGEEGGRQISLKRHILTVKAEEASPQQYSITFDALLVGHEAGVTSLSWRPSTTPSSFPTLLSTSTDSSLIMWSPSTVMVSTEDGNTSIWINRQRFGDIGGQRLGGFVGGVWAEEGKEAVAWGWSGGWRRWRCSNDHGPSTKSSDESWIEIGAISGHGGPVKGLAWSPGGEYLVSTGLDQTSRIHGPIPANGGDSKPSWHELSRPQVHGYDLMDVAFLDSLRFASIADEKVVRIFEAPRGFVDVVEALGVAQFNDKEHQRPIGASVPPLGLSNKAVDEKTIPHIAGQEGSSYRRPFEGELAATTLWPEIEKVFGHGYESISLAVSTSRKLIATACKATTAEHAVVRIYETEKWQLVGEPLAGHSLTVTRIAFSPDDRYVLSVSRDRSWRLFEAQGNVGFHPVAADKSHGRIIWDCAWAPEGDIFATASRDKTVKVWHLGNTGKWSALATIKTQESATAVDFAPVDGKHRRQLAIGIETGVILVYSNPRNPTSDWILDFTIDSRTAHVGHIHRLTWRPQASDPKQLASCSEDSTLRIIDCPNG